MRELSMHVLDLLENAVEAGATRVELTIEEDLAADGFAFLVMDDGRGMDARAAQLALDPFFTTRTTRHVGLGLPLFKAAAERCEGRFTLDSAPGVGTTVSASFRHSHVDRAPLGNIVDTLLAFLLSQRPVDIRYRHRVDDRAFDFDSAAIRAEQEGVPLSHPSVREWLRDFIREGEVGLTSPKGERHAKIEEL